MKEKKMFSCRGVRNCIWEGRSNIKGQSRSLQLAVQVIQSLWRNLVRCNDESDDTLVNCTHCTIFMMYMGQWLSLYLDLIIYTFYHCPLIAPVMKGETFSCHGTSCPKITIWFMHYYEIHSQNYVGKVFQASPSQSH